MKKINISTRVIATCGDLLMLTNDSSVDLKTGFEQPIFVVDKTNGKQITREIPMESLMRFEEDLNWTPTNVYYSDVYQNEKTNNTKLENSSLIGFAIGDAFGVPYEFLTKDEIRGHKLDEMIGKDTNMDFKSRWSDRIMSGAWSDDTSMIYSTMDAIIESKGEFDYSKIMDSYINWWKKGMYCSLDFPFGLGRTVNKALTNYASGVEPLKCGGSEIRDNGNGSLMRILPFSLYCIQCELSMDKTAEIISKGSSLTHAHDISKMGCFIFTEFLRGLYENRNKEMSFADILNIDYYKYFSEEAVDAYSNLLRFDFKDTKDKDINGSGYVVDSLECAIYSVLNTDNFEDAIKMAVNTGYDTDTIAGITGALSGALYGVESFPEKWVSKLRKKDELDLISIKYAILLERIKKNNVNSLFEPETFEGFIKK